MKFFSFKDILISTKYGTPHASSEVGAAIYLWLYGYVLGFISKDSLIIYSALTYSGFLFFTCILSVAQAIQPIASYNLGARLINRLKYIFRFGLGFMIIFSSFIYLSFFMFGDFVVGLFLDDNMLILQAASIMKLFYIGYFFMGINLFCAIYLQSIKRAFSALIITITYTLISVVASLLILSHIFGVSGVWASYPVAQILSFVVSMLVIYYEFKYGIFKRLKRLSKD